jgi:hypothetical protein
MKRLLLVLTLSFFWLISCGGDEESKEPADTGNGGTVEDLIEETAAALDLPAGACSEMPDLTGRAYRVTSLIATQPTDQVNEVWATDIGKYDLVLVFYVVSHNVETGDVELQVTSASAEKTDNGDETFTPVSYKYLLEPATFAAFFDGCKLKWTDPIELNIVTPTISKPFHVFGIVGHVVMSPDGNKLLDSWLEGAILATETHDLCLTIPGLGVANFHWFMNLAHICPDFDSDGDGSIDSYRFSGHLSAVDETELFELGVKPVESLVEDCVPNTEDCVPAG